MRLNTDEFWAALADGLITVGILIVIGLLLVLALLPGAFMTLEALRHDCTDCGRMPVPVLDGPELAVAGADRAGPPGLGHDRLQLVAVG